MPKLPDPSVTQWVERYAAGDAEALDRLVPLLYDDLERIARSRLRHEARRLTLDTGAVVHEAYLRLLRQHGAQPVDRPHFLAIFGRVMRQVVIDQARLRNAQKRGGGERPMTLDESLVAPDEAARLLDLDLALEELGAHEERLARVVECRFFAGLTEDETAEALGVGLRTVQRDWRRARAWLLSSLDPVGGS